MLYNTTKRVQIHLVGVYPYGVPYTLGSSGIVASDMMHYWRTREKIVRGGYPLESMSQTYIPRVSAPALTCLSGIHRIVLRKLPLSHCRRGCLALRYGCTIIRGRRIRILSFLPHLVHEAQFTIPEPEQTLEDDLKGPMDVHSKAEGQQQSRPSSRLLLFVGFKGRRSGYTTLGHRHRVCRHLVPADNFLDFFDGGKGSS